MPHKFGSLLRRLRRDRLKSEEIGAIDPWSVRSKSLGRAERLGYRVNTKWPLLQLPTDIRTTKEIVDHIGNLHAINSILKGTDRAVVTKWLEEHVGPDSFPNQKSQEDPRALAESIWTLMWGVKLVRRFDFAVEASEDLQFMLPDIKANEPMFFLSDRAKLRPASVIFHQLDLAHCITWSIQEAKEHGFRTPKDVEPWVFERRLEALAWLLKEGEWDAIHAGEMSN